MNNDILRFKKGDIIFREGEFGANMFDILYGTVAIYSKYGTPEQQTITTLKEENFFGEMGLVEARPRSATAVAAEDCAVKVITAENLGSYFQEKPAQILAIMQHMSNRIRELSDDYLEACKTISEYLDAEKASQPKPEGLLARMKKFVGVYNRSR